MKESKNCNSRKFLSDDHRILLIGGSGTVAVSGFVIKVGLGMQPQNRGIPQVVGFARTVVHPDFKFIIGQPANPNKGGDQP